MTTRTTKQTEDTGLDPDMAKLEKIFDEARRKIVALISRREKRLVKSFLSAQKNTRKKEKKEDGKTNEDRHKEDRHKEDRPRRGKERVKEDHSDRSSSEHSD